MTPEELRRLSPPSKKVTTCSFCEEAGVQCAAYHPDMRTMSAYYNDKRDDLEEEEWWKWYCCLCEQTEEGSRRNYPWLATFSRMLRVAMLRKGGKK